MALVPLADKGHVLHIFDFRAKPGMGDELIRLFEEFDYSDDNPMHKSDAQVRDGVLCRGAAGFGAGQPPSQGPGFLPDTQRTRSRQGAKRAGGSSVVLDKPHFANMV